MILLLGPVPVIFERSILLLLARLLARGDAKVLLSLDWLCGSFDWVFFDSAFSFEDWDGAETGALVASSRE